MMNKYFLLVMMLPFAVATYAQQASVLATEPAANPTNLNWVFNQYYYMQLQFNASAADGFIVLKSDAAITDEPVDGVTYEKGQGIGASKVVQIAPDGVVFPVNEVLENTTYYFSVFAYNRSGAGINYKQSNPLTRAIKSDSIRIGSYYNGINANASTFITDLHNLISPHTLVFYSDFKSNIIPAIYERDTTGARKVVNCDYSNETTVYTPPFEFTPLKYNREHCLPKSWMLTGGNTANPDGSDYHNLLLTRDIPNNYRSNHPLGQVINATSTFGESKLGKDSRNITVFEPQESRKGDDARSMFYQMICYNGDGGNWGFDNLLTEATDQDQNVLKQWCLQDPPDAYERTRNQFVFGMQGNRNPFVDHPEWVTCINFDALTKLLCNGVGIEEEPATNLALKVYPNPANNMLHVETKTDKQGDIEYTVYDMQGRNLKTINGSINAGDNLITVPVAEFGVGNYLLKISFNGGSAYKKFMIIY